MPHIHPKRSELLLIDFQTRLVPAIEKHSLRVENARRLLVAAQTLGHRVTMTEQYSKGLGPTVEALSNHGGSVFEKTHFDAFKDKAFQDQMRGDADLIVAGVEAHICVLQTVLSACKNARRVFVVADAVGSRHATDRDAALARMGTHGAEIVTTEMVIFEWMQDARHKDFKSLSALIR